MDEFRAKINELEPWHLWGEDVRTFYRLIAKTRALQETLILNRRKISGPLLTGLGQEAVSAGTFFALRKCGILESSIKGPSYRDMYGAVVALDEAAGNNALATDLLRNYLCRATGGNKGRDGNLHWGALSRRLMPFMCSDLAQYAVVSVGYAEELRRRDWPLIEDTRLRPVGIVSFGDGAAQQGIVHEGLNWTAASNFVRSSEEIALLKEEWVDVITKDLRVIRGAPMVFIIHDNMTACFTDSGDEHGASHLSKRAQGYGNMRGVDVDGTNPEAVYCVVVEAIRNAQNLVSTLVVAHDKRLTGHNEDQIARVFSPEDLRMNRKFFEVKSVRGLDTKGLIDFKSAVEMDPVTGVYRSTHLERGLASREDLDGILVDAREEADALFGSIIGEPKITVAEDEKDRSVFPPFAYVSPSEESLGAETGTRMGYNKAFHWIVGKLFEEDPLTVYGGEDVASYEGGVLGLTKGLLARFGPARIWNSSLSEGALVATAAGRALAGGKPIVEFQFSGFAMAGLHVLSRVVAPNWYLKKLKFGLTLICPCGIVHGGSSGYFHEDWPGRFFVPARGIVIVAPATAYEVVGFMRAAHEYEGPVAVFLQTSAASLADFYANVPEEPYVIPFGKARIVREGADVTVVTYGAACVAAAKNEAEKLSGDGISVEVIDLRTVYPWDTETIVSSVAKTGRCMIFQEDYYKTAVGQVLKGALLEGECLEHIKTPHIKVLGAAHPFNPTDGDLMWDSLPYERERDKEGYTRHYSLKLATAIRELMEYR
ncbi:MAG: hypothetical protein HYS73_00500 [Parcubacteria group bacterium]|nr:hypothetical protein [Parcubacteria group bacterium]